MLMQLQPDLKAPLPPELRAYLSAIGRRGAAVHSLNDEARQLGVSVRRLKRQFIAKGYAPESALNMARARLHLGRRGGA
jgi:hypothetical protein